MSQDYIQKVTVRGSNPLCDDILMYDNFEGRLNWAGSGTGTDWVVAQSSGGNEMIDGLYGLKLQTRTTTPAAGNWVTAIRYMGQLPGRILRYFVYFRPVGVNGCSSVDFGFYLYNGQTVTYVIVSYFVGDHTWKYYTPSGTWVAIPGMSMVYDPNAWSYLEFLYDVDTNMLCGGRSGQMASPVLSLLQCQAPSTVAPAVAARFTLTTSGPASQVFYYDHVMLSVV